MKCLVFLSIDIIKIVKIDKQHKLIFIINFVSFFLYKKVHAKSIREHIVLLLLISNVPQKHPPEHQNILLINKSHRVSDFFYKVAVWLFNFN